MYGIEFSEKVIKKLIEKNLFTKDDWELDGYTIFDDIDFKYEFIESGNMYVENSIKLYLIVGSDRETAMNNLQECFEYLRTFDLHFSIKDVVKIGGFIG